MFFEPPAVGSGADQGRPYAEIESVKAVSDVIAPLSGEIIEVNAALVEEPGGDQRGPLRGGLAREGAACRTPPSAEALLDAAAYARRSLARLRQT